MYSFAFDFFDSMSDERGFFMFLFAKLDEDDGFFDLFSVDHLLVCARQQTDNSLTIMLTEKFCHVFGSIVCETFGFYREFVCCDQISRKDDPIHS